MINTSPGQSYHASGWFKLQNGGPETLELEIDFTLQDDSHQYVTAARHQNAHVSDGWIHVQGTFVAPMQSKLLSSTPNTDGKKILMLSIGLSKNTNHLICHNKQVFT